MMLYKDHGHQYLCAFFESAWGRGGKALLILNLNRGEICQPHALGIWYLMLRMLGGPPKPVWTFWRQEKNLLPLQGIKP